MFLAIAILVLGLLILVHELGHFLAAKAVGIGVIRLSIGFGPPTPLRFRRGETEYVVSWIPLGGYVKLATREEQEAMAALEGGRLERGFPVEKLLESKPVWARILVMSAGVIMNVLLTWAVYSGLALVYGRVEDPTTTLARVEASALPGAAAALGEVPPGTRILRVNGEEVDSWDDVLDGLRRDLCPDSLELDFAGETGTIVVEIPGTNMSARAAIAGALIPLAQPHLAQRRVRFGLWGAVVEGGRRTWDTAAQVLCAVQGLVTGEISSRDLSGPIGIAQASAEVARAGLRQLLQLMAFVSVNLAIVNLLPIPVLDGGHLVFLILEGIRRKPLSAELRYRLTQVGILVILGIMVLALRADLLRLLGW